MNVSGSYLLLEKKISFWLFNLTDVNIDYFWLITKWIRQNRELINRSISTYAIKNTSFSNKQAKIGAVTPVQRFGSAPNPGIHFNVLSLYGAISENARADTAFTCIKRSTHDDMATLGIPTFIAS